MKKLCLIVIIALFGFFTEEAYALSLTNPCYMPKKGEIQSDTIIEYKEAKNDSVMTAGKTVTKMEVETHKAKESVKYGIEDNLLVGLDLEYSMNELESRNSSGILSEYEYQGFENPQFVVKWKPIRKNNWGAGGFLTASFDMLKADETSSDYRDGTVANGRNEVGLGLFYGKVLKRFTTVLIGSVTYLGTAKINKIQTNGDKDSIQDNKHYQYDLALKTEFLITDKFSANVDLGYTAMAQRTVRNKTQNTEWDRSDGDTIAGALQLNYAINDSLSLATYYQYIMSDDTVFDFANPTSDYEYKHTRVQAGGIKMVTKF